MREVKYAKTIKKCAEELKRLLKQEKDIRIYRKIKPTYLLKTIENVTWKEAAEKLELSIQAAKDVIIRGYNIKERRVETFKERLKDGFDTLKEMQEWIREKFDKELSTKTRSKWCRKTWNKKGQAIEYKER